MKNILIRAGKDPRIPLSEGDTLALNPIGSNSGNMLFGYSVFQSLVDANHHVVADDYKIERNEISPITPAQVNETYSAFVVPLANAFRPNYIYKLERLTAFVSQLKIPCVVVGVGAQTDLSLNILKEQTQLDSAVKRFVSAVLDRSASIGVRGQITREYLNRLGFKDVNVIGCPSMYINGPDLKIHKRSQNLSEVDAIAINYTPGMPHNVEAFIKKLYTNFQAAHYIPQNIDDHRLMYYGQPIYKINKNSAFPYHIGHPLMASGRARFFFDVTTWLNAMEAYTFTIGTRVHGTIASLLAGDLSRLFRSTVIWG